MKNPISKNWYADPESRVYGDTVFMYVTNSLPFDEQKNLDLVTTKILLETYHKSLNIFFRLLSFVSPVKYKQILYYKMFGFAIFFRLIMILIS